MGHLAISIYSPVGSRVLLRFGVRRGRAKISVGRDGGRLHSSRQYWAWQPGVNDQRCSILWPWCHATFLPWRAALKSVVSAIDFVVGESRQPVFVAAQKSLTGGIIIRFVGCSANVPLICRYCLKWFWPARRKSAGLQWPQHALWLQPFLPVVEMPAGRLESGQSEPVTSNDFGIGCGPAWVGSARFSLRAEVPVSASSSSCKWAEMFYHSPASINAARALSLRVPAIVTCFCLWSANFHEPQFCGKVNVKRGV